jgi:hypothetical protein
METIAKTDHFSVQINLNKNCLYLMGKGFWKNTEIAQQFLRHVKQGIARLSPGHSVLVDLHEFKTPPPQVGEIIIEVQKIAANTFGKSAQVVGENKGIAMPMERYARSSGIQGQQRSFATTEEAEAWLDADEAE